MMMVPGKPTKAIGYGRVSRVAGRSGDSFQSPEDQRKAIEDWCARQDPPVELIDHLHEDDVSGGTIDRPRFQEALRRIDAGEANALVTAKLDRFARSIPAMYQAIQRLEDANAAFVSVDDGFDLSTAHGRMFFNIMGSFAQFELDRMREQWVGSKANAIREKGWQIGPTPLGYVREGEKDGRPQGKLVPDAATAPHVQEAFVLAGTKGLSAAAKYLAEHVRTKTFTVHNEALAKRYGVKPGERVTVDATWNVATVRRLVTSRCYRGEAYYGEELVNAAAHEPVVDESTFELAQAAAKDKRVVRARQRYPLASICRCASCDNELVGSMSGPKGNYVRMYRCSAWGRKHESCDAPANVLAEPLERWVALVVAKRAAERARAGEAPPDTEALKGVLERAGQELHEWASWRRDERERLGQDVWQAQLEARAADRDEAAEAYREAIDNPPPPEPHEVFGEVMYLTGGTVTVDPGHPLEDELEVGPDLEGLRELFERGVRSMTIAPGRGSTPARLAERVTLELR